MQLLEHVKSTVPDTEVIIITGYASIETAVEAMRKGAYQYLAKPIRLDEVCVMAEKALEKRRLRQEVDSLRRPEGIRCAHYHRAEPRRACAQGEYCPGCTGGLHRAHSR
jgi:DNA-binding NtrC family response regulator